LQLFQKTLINLPQCTELYELFKDSALKTMSNVLRDITNQCINKLIHISIHYYVYLTLHLSLNLSFTSLLFNLNV